MGLGECELGELGEFSELSELGELESCFLITLINCLKGHKSLGSLFEGAL